MMMKRYQMENEIIRGLIHFEEREEILEKIDESIFEINYNKEIYKALKNLYDRHHKFCEEDIKYIISNLNLEMDIVNEIMMKDGLSFIRVNEYIQELKKMHLLNKLNILAKDITKDISNMVNPEDIIFKLKECIDNCNSGYFNRIYYKKKGNKIIVDKAQLAEWIKEKYNIIKKDKHMYIYENGVYQYISDGMIKELIYDNLNGEYKADINLINNTREIMKAIKNKGELQELDLTQNINFKNCILDLKEKKVKEHSPNILSTIQINSNYNKDAKCPYFLEWVKGRFAEEDILTIQEMLGYMMTGSVQGKAFFMLYGEGDTGKSTFINIVQEIIGNKNIAALTIQQLGERFAVAELHNKIVNVYADLPKESMKENIKLKELVSGDLVTVERKNKDPFMFNNMAKFLFSCNTLPPTSDRTDAFFNRCIIITMNNKIKVKDPDCMKKLLKEKEGIILWAIEGLYRLINNKYKFTISKQTQLNINKYKEENDSLEQFLKEKCIQRDGISTPISIFKDVYAKYCRSANLKVVTGQTVNSMLKEKGYNIKKVNNIYNIMGIGLLQ